MTGFTDLLARADAAVTAALGPAPAPVGVPQALRTADTLAGRIDHTQVRAPGVMTNRLALQR